MTDEDIVRQILEGNDKLYDKLVMKHTKQINHVAFKYLKSNEDAEEAAQDTFIRAYNRLDNFNSTSSFYTWLHRIAVNICNRILEKRRRNKVETTNTVEDLVTYADPETNLLDKQLEDKANTAINNLPTKLKDMFEMRYGNTRMSYSAIAEQLNIPIGTVRSRLAKIRADIEASIA